VCVCVCLCVSVCVYVYVCVCVYVYDTTPILTFSHTATLANPPPHAPLHPPTLFHSPYSHTRSPGLKSWYAGPNLKEEIRNKKVLPIVTFIRISNPWYAGPDLKQEINKKIPTVTLILISI
jgi:hypothetical protein